MFYTGWETWGAWGECSTQTTCGSGVKVRHRACSNGGTVGVDRYCLGLANESAPCNSVPCNGPMRIVGGSVPGEGRVEIYDDQHQQWSLVCADQMTLSMAKMVCRQLGWPNGHSVVTDGRFGSGNGQFGLTNVACKGSELTIAACEHNKWTSTGICNGGATLAAGVQCDVNGVWSLWSSWSQCSVTCEGGFQTRTRQCNHPAKQHGGRDCQGESVQTRSCTLDMCPVNGVWQAWGPWDACSVTCGNGTQSRRRNCHGPFYNGEECQGEANQTRDCMDKHCPVDGVWTDWFPWGECSQTCAGGTRTRHRNCTGPLYEGRPCDGASQEEESCNTHNCPVDGVWRAWSAWSECTVTCGNGTQWRNRTCEGPYHLGKDCEGEDYETQVCLPRICPVDGKWLPWNDWGVCSKTCGTGTQERFRVCEGPFYDGENCTGPDEEHRDCNTHHCPIDGEWETWSVWSACSVTCGGGNQSRFRECQGPFYGGLSCDGPREMSRICSTNSCPEDGYFTSWSEWEACDVTCGDGGVRRRYRSCVGPFYGGNDCEGQYVDTGACNVQPCPIDGVLTAWSNWSDCSVTCGGGVANRSRDCNGPKYGGKDCEGPRVEHMICNEESCPEDGAWLPWSHWDECSVTCGGGDQARNRTCIGTSHGGEYCEGDHHQVRECNTHHCPIDGVWNPWSVWDECSVTCGGGFQARNRSCDGPYYKGLDCQGDAVENQTCNTQPCPIDGYYEDWSAWSQCSLTCGGGFRSRDRSCVTPQHGGMDCQGASNETQDCNTQPCPVDGVFLAWSEWSECSVSCGGGQQWKNRTCQAPQHGGQDCAGPDNVTQTCNTQPCPIPGDWFPWTEWTRCAVTCGGGIRARERVCDTESYGNLTAPCEGLATESAPCHDFDCLPLATTCSDLAEKGLRENNIVEIDVDGPGPFTLDPVMVYCDMDTDSGVGVTVVGHDQEDRVMVQGMEAADGVRLNYNISFEHVLELVDRSASCKQYISWECFAAIIHSKQGKPITGWLDRYQDMADYFGGASPGSRSCACGMNNTCVEEDLKCNCDANDLVWRQDEGDLTFKDDLPVSAFVSGDTDGKNENGYKQIGPLHCQGRDPTFVKIG
ncbi:SCO-spondin-like [Elysia marginata]|uniref:SCO-spondin-like n=1 Tax=Elysia marginata TaxID=1093978 RepID=A0AAV4I645_9GAST|nr:SCO-spondin-like [Elysia marginata]